MLRKNAVRLCLFLVIIFSNAFLLFQVQPLLTKELLPRFGGSASVWSASMLFYQVLLLCGYLYAHLLSRCLLRWQFTTHATLLVFAALITFSQIPQELPFDLPPVLEIVLILTAEVAVAFVLLSSTSVLLQHWYVITLNGKGSKPRVPYHWYAVSNVGSLLALVSYPFVFEINFALSTQKSLWMMAFVFVVVLQLWLMFSLKGLDALPITTPGKANQTRPDKRQVLLWLCFSATTSIMLIATTQMISTNIPPMPLVWVIPLAIYLLSFIFCFSSEKAYQRSLWLPLLIFSILAGLMMFFVGSQFDGLIQLLMYGFILFVCCCVCHGELRQLAPSNDSMTLFYLYIALGGALGSLFTSLFAPLLFERITEYVLALFLVMLLFGIVLKTSAWLRMGWSVLLLAVVFGFVGLEQRFTQYDVASQRNFYGFITVKDINNDAIAERRLVDGTTVHGSEPLRNKTLTNDGKTSGSYYQSDSGVVQALNYIQQQEATHIGVIGLGAGVLAEFTRETDAITFYELNPAVVSMAHDYFSYLSNARGRVEVTIDDGRLALDKRLMAGEPRLDALVIDAFSSDVIPSHLLTREAMELYWGNLKEDGLLIIHISNNYIDLLPVINAHRISFDKHLVRFKKRGNGLNAFGSDWVVLTSDSGFTQEGRRENAFRSPVPQSNIVHQWTDERQTILPLIKFFK